MRKVIFEGNSLETKRQFPDDARLRDGYEIDCVQRDKEPENWKPFSSVGHEVINRLITYWNNFDIK